MATGKKTNCASCKDQKQIIRELEKVISVQQESIRRLSAGNKESWKLEEKIKVLDYFLKQENRDKEKYRRKAIELECTIEEVGLGHLIKKEQPKQKSKDSKVIPISGY